MWIQFMRAESLPWSVMCSVRWAQCVKGGMWLTETSKTHFSYSFIISFHLLLCKRKTQSHAICLLWLTEESQRSPVVQQKVFQDLLHKFVFSKTVFLHYPHKSFNIISSLLISTCKFIGTVCLAHNSDLSQVNRQTVVTHLLWGLCSKPARSKWKSAM